MPVLEKVRPLIGVRGMVEAVPNRRRRSLGQGATAGARTARWPWAGWTDARPAVIAGEVRDEQRSPKVEKKR
jgi:hypothetical protein